jgi:carbonic anhydrase
VRKLLHFDTYGEAYRADAAVIGCFDCRFDAVTRKLLKRLGIGAYDWVRAGGSTRNLLAADDTRKFLLDQLRASIRLHQTARLLLLNHSDCGAYGGRAAFRDAQEEAQRHWNDLQSAAAVVNEQIPGLTIECYYLGADGVWA